MQVTRTLSRSGRRPRVARSRLSRHIRAAGKFTRRRLMRDAAAMGAVCAVLPRVAGQSHGRNTETRTLYFNFSHLELESATYFVMIAGTRYGLQRVQAGDALLAAGKLRNRFLARLPDSAITHILPNVQLPADGASLNYSIVKSSNQPAAEWSMPSIFYTFPSSSAIRSFKRMRKTMAPGQPLPLSAKRYAYGIEAANSLQDLLDEQDFVDSSDTAAAMIFSHPEVACGEATAGKYVHDMHVASSRALFPLSQAVGQRMAASPEVTPGQPNAGEWATLTPITDEDGNQLVNTNPKAHNYGLNYYEPQWHPDLHPLIRTAAANSIGAVKNDTTLGVDITNSASLAANDFTGKLWMRRDGVTSIDQSSLSATDSDNLGFTLTSPNPSGGFDLSVSLAQNGANVDVTVTYTNSYVRFLGAYVQFLNGTTVVDKSKVPGISIFPELDTDTNALYIGLVTPEFEILGVPVSNSTRTVTFTFPAQVATSAKFLASGLGTGSHTFLETEGVGTGLTLVFSLILPALLLGIGLGIAIDSFVKFVLLPVVNIIITGILAAGDTSDQAQIRTIILRALIKPPAIKGLLTLAQNVAEWMTINAAGVAAEDAIPIVGTIIQIVGILGATAEILQTAVETSLAPYTYEYDFVPTHDLAVSVQHDPMNDRFPSTATSYKVNAIFDSGKPYTATLPMPSGDVTSLPPVTFRNVPLGGLVRSAVGFYADTGWLAGQGSSASVPNTIRSRIGITIQQKQIPIGSSTQYTHQAKTALNDSGTRVWVSGAPAPVAAGTSCENAPGNLCNLRSLTVRQGNAKQPGYVGYSWQSYASGAAECFSGGQGQLDFAANMPDVSSSGGYAALPCGLLTATRVVYGLLAQTGSDYYIDASSGSNIVRQIQLAQPHFNDPRDKMSWGVFNLESTSLLLHPSGRLVSINNQNSKIETLILPLSASPDAESAVQSIAQLHSSQGSRPGLIDSPVAAAITSEGVVLVLESGNNRIHALDTSANPVPFFSKQKSPYFLYLDATNNGDTVYLDIAVEFSGYIYVLSSNQNVFRLDIYYPGQSETQPVSTTQSVNGGRLAVDFWRNLYTLNYELLQTTNGAATSMTEPSLSLWTPSAPSLFF